MNKNTLLKTLSQASRGNFFTIELPVQSGEEAETIEQVAAELEREGKIKIRECTSKESSIYIQGIIKYALT
ncbi:hypothetical protein [Rossellomorea vietnamensis]|uniref:Uncharacterized protein n=1 Tax=Rossellomorea vietnamensis TaxID=218284 RepID=A0A0P6W4B7_9BACI|nr:hypothetical protein [Rossellomorea vietnamensis]KPL60365.1 hypothetical protein AM506_07100 [Rossellomorea vietnamensis]